MISPLAPRRRCPSSHIVFAAYLVLTALWLGHRARYGFSPLDIGMYMSGYEHFNTEPMTLSYLGQWQLTYQLTGWLCSLTGIDTFYGLRLLRVALLLVLQTILWCCLNKRMSHRALLAGLGLTTLSQYGAYHELNYNDWSAFWLIVAVLAYHRGLTTSRRPQLWTALSGLLLGMNIFFRVVNISFLLLPLAGWLAVRYMDRRDNTRTGSLPVGRQTAFFFSGVMAGVGFVVLLSHLTGTLTVLTLTLNDIVSIGGANTDSHGMNIILRKYAEVLADVGKAGLLCTTFILLARYAAAPWIGRLLASSSLQPHRIAGTAGQAACIAAAAAVALVPLYAELLTPHSHPHHILAVGYCLLPIGMCCTNPRLKTDRRMELLYLLGVLAMLILPLGSNAGVVFIYPVMPLLALPLTMYYIQQAMQHETLTEQYAHRDAPLMRPVQWWTTSVAAMALSLLITSLTFSEMEDVAMKQADTAINSAKAAHISTGETNATMHDTLLEALDGRIPEGSYLITNVSVPLISMLHCRPYAVFSDLFSSDAMNDRYLQRAFDAGNPPSSTGHTVLSAPVPYILVSEVDMRQGFGHVMEWLKQRHTYTLAWEQTVPVPASNGATQVGRVYLLAPEDR